MLCPPVGNLDVVLIWINGAFGVGKTQTAHELYRRLPAAHVADPELLGFAIHKMLPPSARADFQDRPQWRSAVFETLVQVCHETVHPVIVPMTLVNPEYFDEIVGRLRGEGLDVRHYALTASVQVIHRRLRSRLASVFGRIVGADETWAMQHAQRCSAALQDERFETRIATDDLSVDEVVERIAETVGLHLVRPRLGTPRYQLRRAAVAVPHIRL
ncbi:tunicamycin resistance protein [Rhodococcoides trifolii]|uniref:Tunicamycin resistance protein n=1 Tax=Rhodococcoides trifolii TaxID=908250 RepID=A0A917G8F0_9NOCA|nr:AAA family ATPase [Rhodococcus trifolii]GGG27718.1 tunicamycin resistance protein [Rhodococcus trifolii]